MLNESYYEHLLQELLHTILILHHSIVSSIQESILSLESMLVDKYIIYIQEHILEIIHVYLLDICLDCLLQVKLQFMKLDHLL